MPDRLFTIDERRAILDAEIARYVQTGWRVDNRTDTTAQVSKDVRLNGFVLVVMLLLIVPALLYLLLHKSLTGYAMNLHLEVDKYGQITRT